MSEKHTQAHVTSGDKCPSLEVERLTVEGRADSEKLTLISGEHVPWGKQVELVPASLLDVERQEKELWRSAAEKLDAAHDRSEVRADRAEEKLGAVKEALEEWNGIGQQVRDSLDLGLGAMRDREGNRDPRPSKGFCLKLDDALRAARAAHKKSRSALDACRGER